MNGTAFESRDDAIASFKTKHSDQFPTKFESEPTSRPSYIPESTSVNGTNYSVTYNTTYGGYGYAGPSGWVAYDPLLDYVILSSLMRDRDYVVYEKPYYSPSAEAVSPAVAHQVHHSNGLSSFFAFLSVCVVIGGCVVVFVIFMNKKD